MGHSISVASGFNKLPYVSRTSTLSTEYISTLSVCMQIFLFLNRVHLNCPKLIQKIVNVSLSYFLTRILLINRNYKISRVFWDHLPTPFVLTLVFIRLDSLFSPLLVIFSLCYNRSLPSKFTTGVFLDISHCHARAKSRTLLNFLYRLQWSLYSRDPWSSCIFICIRRWRLFPRSIPQSSNVIPTPQWVQLRFVWRINFDKSR